MSEDTFSAILLQPHDTPLSQMLAQHRQILGKLAESCHAVLPDHQVYPLAPSHCLVQSPLEIQQLKKNLRGCTIMPPVFSQGLLVRPVQLVGAELAPLSLHSLLPAFHQGVKCLENFATGELPGGFVFGCIKNRQEERIRAEDNRAAIHHIHEIINSFAIQPLKLRVFRLHSAEYRWCDWPGHHQSSQEEVPEHVETRALTWTLGSPQWVKIK